LKKILIKPQKIYKHQSRVPICPGVMAAGWREGYICRAEKIIDTTGIIWYTD
jgi:hypothetical protein